MHTQLSILQKPRLSLRPKQKVKVTFSLFEILSWKIQMKTTIWSKMAEEWDEIKKLAADLQRAQLGGAVQKLSEANCIEIINCLVNSGQLKVIYTTDGKEYLTHKQLER